MKLLDNGMLITAKKERYILGGCFLQNISKFFKTSLEQTKCWTNLYQKEMPLDVTIVS